MRAKKLLKAKKQLLEAAEKRDGKGWSEPIKVVQAEVKVAEDLIKNFDKLREHLIMYRGLLGAVVNNGTVPGKVGPVMDKALEEYQELKKILKPITHEMDFLDLK